MKKLSYLIKLLVVILAVAGCHGTRESQRREAEAPRQPENVTTASRAGAGNTGTARIPGDTVTKKKPDSASKSYGGQAIIHHTPDDARLDSIKEAKTKKKK